MAISKNGPTRFPLKAMMILVDLEPRNLEHPDNLIKEARRDEVNNFGASLPVYKTLPVDSRGVLKGTDDTNLDGDVESAFDLMTTYQNQIRFANPLSVTLSDIS